MKTLDVESVKTLIQSRLSKNEKLLSCSQAHGTESIYVAITKDTYYYKIFRLMVIKHYNLLDKRLFLTVIVTFGLSRLSVICFIKKETGITLIRVSIWL